MTFSRSLLCDLSALCVCVCACACVCMQILNFFIFHIGASLCFFNLLANLPNLPSAFRRNKREGSNHLIKTLSAWTIGTCSLDNPVHPETSVFCQLHFSNNLVEVPPAAMYKDLQLATALLLSL